MTLAEAGIAGSVCALAVGAGAAGGVAWAGPVDRPRERGSHHRPTPTSGGLAIIAGASAGLLVFAALSPSHEGLGQIAAALGFASALGLAGALDDLFDLDARIKFLVQIAAAFLFAVFVARIEAIPISVTVALPLGPILGVLGTALWLLVSVNAMNFMDGADGLAAGSAAIALLAFALAAFDHAAAPLGGAALVGAMGGLGFLPWNFPKARLFQGDSGALFSGFLLPALAVIGGGALGRGPVFVLFAPLILLPFLADVLLTLLARARGRKRLFDAHSEHLYQRWLARRGGSHGALAWRMFAIMALYAAGAVAAARGGATTQLLVFLAGTGVAVLAWGFLSRSNPLAKA